VKYLKRFNEDNSLNNQKDFEDLIDLLKHEIFEDMDIYACETADPFTQSAMNKTFYYSAPVMDRPYGIKNRLVIDNVYKEDFDKIENKIKYIKDNSMNMLGRQIDYVFFRNFNIDRIVVFFENEK